MVISFLDTPNFYAELATLVTGVKCIVSERSAFSNPDRIPLKKRILCYFHAFAHAIVANSNYHKNALIKAFPFLKPKVQVILNIVNTTFFEIARERRWDEPIKILCVGSINSNKNPQVVINALHVLKEKYHQHLRVDWAGKISDMAYFDKCNNLIKSYKLESNWCWLGELSDIPSLHSNHNLLIHASHFEGLPNAVCEAMASGMIVVASDVCEHPSLLSNLGVNLLFNPNNESELADRINAILSFTVMERQLLSNKIQTKALEIFSKEVVINEFEQVILNSF